MRPTRFPGVNLVRDDEAGRLAWWPRRWVLAIGFPVVFLPMVLLPGASGVGVLDSDLMFQFAIVRALEISGVELAGDFKTAGEVSMPRFWKYRSIPSASAIARWPLWNGTKIISRNIAICCSRPL
jgi:hypothetical protein